MGLFNKLLYNEDFQRVEADQRFNYMLQTMQSNRWKITLLILFTFFFIVFGIVMAVMFKATIEEAWKIFLKQNKRCFYKVYSGVKIISITKLFM